MGLNSIAWTCEAFQKTDITCLNMAKTSEDYTKCISDFNQCPVLNLDETFTSDRSQRPRLETSYHLHRRCQFTRSHISVDQRALSRKMKSTTRPSFKASNQLKPGRHCPLSIHRKRLPFLIFCGLQDPQWSYSYLFVVPHITLLIMHRPTWRSVDIIYNRCPQQLPENKDFQRSKRETRLFLSTCAVSVHL